jgi:hypothetical protein
MGVDGERMAREAREEAGPSSEAMCSMSARTHRVRKEVTNTRRFAWWRDCALCRSWIGWVSRIAWKVNREGNYLPSRTSLVVHCQSL